MLMTVPERIARSVRSEIDCDCIEGHHVDDVFAQTAHLFVFDLRNLEGMPVQVNRMLIAAAVAQQQTIAPPGMHLDEIDVGPRSIVDRPRVELRAIHRSDIAEGQRDGFIGS